MAKTLEEQIQEYLTRGQNQANQLYEQRKKADASYIQQANEAVDRTTTASVKPYQTQVEQLPASYQELYDANAVQELVGRRKVRETMANMGLTDSGLNRTQQTALSIQRGNADAAARLEQQKKTQALQDQIAQLIAGGEAQKQQQAAAVYSGTGDWYNNLLANTYQTAVQQGTSAYNAELEAQAARYAAEQERAAAIEKAKYEAQVAQANAAAKAKQQERADQLALLKWYTNAGLSADEAIGRVYGSAGLPVSNTAAASKAGSVQTGNVKNVQTAGKTAATSKGTAVSSIAQGAADVAKLAAYAAAGKTPMNLSKASNAMYISNLKRDMQNGLSQREALNAIVDHVYRAYGLNPSAKNAELQLSQSGRSALQALINEAGLGSAANYFGKRKGINASAYF